VGGSPPAGGRVGSCEDGGSGLEHGGDARLGHRDGLLLHGLPTRSIPYEVCQISWISATKVVGCSTANRQGHSTINVPLVSLCSATEMVCCSMACRQA